MRISVVSRSWPSNERSGVSLVAADHVKLLSESGHEVSIIGSNIAVLDEKLPVTNRYYIKSYGSGALYAPAFIDKSKLANIFKMIGSELVIVEAWQTAVTDAAIQVAHNLGIPLLMVSHGVSVHPFTSNPIDIIRSLGWFHYRMFFLPHYVALLNAMTTLDEHSVSMRFYDRKLAERLNIPIIPLVNSGINYRGDPPSLHHRKRQILVVGYFSPIKNQLGALEILAGIDEPLQLKFIGECKGDYFNKCVKRALDLGIGGRVIFSQDNECNVADEIASSLIVLSTSVTEVLPVTLLEAMASGTPFIATPVGAIPNMGAGIIADDLQSQRNAIKALVNNKDLWQEMSQNGLSKYAKYYARECVRKSLLDAVFVATRKA